MIIFADLHVHIYPGFDVDRTITSVFERFSSEQSRLSEQQSALFLIGLTEREDCNFYSGLQAGKYKVSSSMEFKNRIECVEINKSSSTLLIFPGRQLNTVERVELLSLGSDQLIPAGQSLQESLEQIDRAGAVPVINWAPGKWWFERGRLVRKVIETFPDKFLLGDTSLRPIGYLRPDLMKLADVYDRKIIYGSDPLPDPAEQNIIGSYCSLYQADFDLSQPLKSYRNLLLNHVARPVGKRSNILELIWRLGKYYLMK